MQLGAGKEPQAHIYVGIRLYRIGHYAQVKFVQPTWSSPRLIRGLLTNVLLASTIVDFRGKFVLKAIQGDVE